MVALDAKGPVLGASWASGKPRDPTQQIGSLAPGESRSFIDAVDSPARHRVGGHGSKVVTVRYYPFATYSSPSGCED